MTYFSSLYTAIITAFIFAQDGVCAGQNDTLKKGNTAQNSAAQKKKPTKKNNKKQRKKFIKPNEASLTKGRSVSKKKKKMPQTQRTTLKAQWNNSPRSPQYFSSITSLETGERERPLVPLKKTEDSIPAKKTDTQTPITAPHTQVIAQAQAPTPTSAPTPASKLRTPPTHTPAHAITKDPTSFQKKHNNKKDHTPLHKNPPREKTIQIPFQEKPNGSQNTQNIPPIKLSRIKASKIETIQEPIQSSTRNDAATITSTSPQTTTSQDTPTQKEGGRSLTKEEKKPPERPQPQKTPHKQERLFTHPKPSWRSPNRLPTIIENVLEEDHPEEPHVREPSQTHTLKTQKHKGAHGKHTSPAITQKSQSPTRSAPVSSPEKSSPRHQEKKETETKKPEETLEEWQKKQGLEAVQHDSEELDDFKDTTSDDDEFFDASDGS